MESLKEIRKIKPSRVWRENTRRLFLPYKQSYLGLPVFSFTLCSSLLFLFVILNSSLVSLPGEKLYGLKKVLERAQIGLSLGESQKSKLELEFVGRRADELTQLGQKINSAGKEQNVFNITQETFNTFKSAKSQFKEAADRVSSLSERQKREVEKLLTDKARAVNNAVSGLPNNLKSDLVNKLGESLDGLSIDQNEENNSGTTREDIKSSPEENIFRAPTNIKNPHSNSRYQQ